MTSTDTVYWINHLRAKVSRLNGLITELESVTAPPTISTKTADYTLTDADSGTIIIVNSASDLVVTVPAGLTLSEVTIVRYGTGAVTIEAAVGVTVNSADSALSIGVQYAGSSLIYVAEDEYLLLGNLA
jgi:hypothetical protein